MRNTVLAAVCAVLAVFVASGVGALQPSPGPSPKSEEELVYVRMSTGMGEIVFELNRAKAPVTVDNFLKYADRGAYDGTVFHRIVKDFVIQGGGWTADLKERAKEDAAKGNPDKPIKNEWQNGLKNTRGSIAMAREAEPDTATREFYINCQDNPKLDTAREKSGNAGYAVFGRVVAGIEIVDKIRGVRTEARTVPGVTDGSMENVPVDAVPIVSVKRISTSEARAAIAAAEEAQKKK
jgi:cyclophilin family peptidyl-prolyl cis-trans isomerase